MSDGCKETLCTSCSHWQVCSLKMTYLKAQEAIDRACFNESEGDGVRTTYVANLRDWLTIPALQCKHYQRREAIVTR